MRDVVMAKVKDILTRKPLGQFATIAEDRVYEQKYSPLTDHGDNSAYLPCIVLMVFDEEYAEVDWTQDRATFPICLDIYATGQDAKTQLKTMVQQAKQQLRHDHTLEDTIERIRLKKIEYKYDSESESLIEAARMTWDVSYIEDTTSTLALDDFDETDVTFKAQAGTTPTTMKVEMNT